MNRHLGFAFSLAVAISISPGCASAVSAHRASRDVTVPFTMHDNRILVEVILNNDGPFTFIFDTGGSRSNTITPEVARRLGLSTAKGEDATGAGEKAVSYWTTKIDHYSIDGLTLRNQSFGVLDMSAIRKAFRFPRLDGVIGFDVLDRPVTCIDFEKQTLSFKDEGPGCFAGGGEVISFRREGDIPVISGAIDGISTEFVLDTGDRSAFTFFQKFAEKSGVASRFDGKPEIISGMGIGGPIPARLSEIPALRLGSRTLIRSVLARLPLTKSGYFAKAKPTLAGSVGNEVLRRFNVVFNYPKHELTLIANRHFNEPFRFTPLPAAE